MSSYLRVTTLAKKKAQRFNVSLTNLPETNQPSDTNFHLGTFRHLSMGWHITIPKDDYIWVNPPPCNSGNMWKLKFSIGPFVKLNRFIRFINCYRVGGGPKLYFKSLHSGLGTLQPKQPTVPAAWLRGRLFSNAWQYWP